MSLSSNSNGLRRLQEMWHRFLGHILHAHDSPHRLALGAAIGMFVAFTPTVGFQMLIVPLLAWVLRANTAVGVPLVWISNPITIPPIFYAGYTLGRLLLGREPLDETWWASLAIPPDNWLDLVVFYWSRSIEIAWPLWIGSTILAALTAVPTYTVVLRAVTTHRHRTA